MAFPTVELRQTICLPPRLPDTEEKWLALKWKWVLLEKGECSVFQAQRILFHFLPMSPPTPFSPSFQLTVNLGILQIFSTFKPAKSRTEQITTKGCYAVIALVLFKGVWCHPVWFQCAIQILATTIQACFPLPHTKSVVVIHRRIIKCLLFA